MGITEVMPIFMHSIFTNTAMKKYVAVVWVKCITHIWSKFTVSKKNCMSEVIVNKVAESSLLTIDLADYIPQEEPVIFDLKEYLFMGLIVKEKEFRAALQQTTIDSFRDKTVLVLCTTDAIIPMWAYMLVAAHLQPAAKELFLGTKEEWKKKKLLDRIAVIDLSVYKDQRIVIKGCGDEPVPEAAYLEITNRLRPIVKSLMYGEPCSTVPIFKQPKPTT